VPIASGGLEGELLGLAKSRLWGSKRGGVLPCTIS